MPTSDNRKARAGVPGLDGSGSAELQSEIDWPLLDIKSPADLQAAIFTARPRGTLWAVAAISHAGEAVKLGIFAHRKDALSAAAVMAGVCSGAWLP